MVAEDFYKGDGTVSQDDVLGPNEEGLPRSAKIVLRIILLLWPGRAEFGNTDRQYLLASYELMQKGLLEIVQQSDQNFRVQLTPRGREVFNSLPAGRETAL